MSTARCAHLPSLLKVKYEVGSVSETNFPMGKLPTSVGTAVGVTDGMTVGAVVAVGTIVAVAVGTTVGSAVGVSSAFGAHAETMNNPTTINR